MTDPVIPTDLRPRILLGHVLDRLREMPEGSVQMAVTSPPYWGLRAYGTPPQVWGGDRDHAHEWQVTPPRRFRSEADATSDIEKASIGGRSHEAQGGQVCGCGAWLGELGAEPTPELYVAHLADVFDEVRRVLRDDGTLWLNLGDSYIGGGRGSGIGKDGKRSLSSNQFWDQNDDGQVPLAKPHGVYKGKDMAGVPWMVAFELRRRGWFLRSDIIWQKPNPMPESVTDRPTRSHEYVFLLTKRGSYYYDQDAVRNPLVESTFERAQHHYANPVDNPETDSKHGSGNPLSYPIQGKKQDTVGNRRYTGFNARWDAREAALSGYSPSTLREVSEGYDGKATKPYEGTGAQDPSATKARIIEGIRARQEAGISGPNLKSVWEIAPQPYPDSHFATFPEALPERCIRLGTSEKGCCPKCGAPWERQVKEPPVHGPSNSDYKSDNADLGKHSFDSGKEWSDWLERYPRVVTGWSPTCSCGPGLDPIPCLVLDPFAGSGTVGQVARRLGRRSVLIELNPAYVTLARKRAGQTGDILSFGDPAIPAPPSNAGPGSVGKQGAEVAADEGTGNPNTVPEAGP